MSGAIIELDETQPARGCKPCGNLSVRDLSRNRSQRSTAGPLILAGFLR